MYYIEKNLNIISLMILKEFSLYLESLLALYVTIVLKIVNLYSCIKGED